MALFLPGIVDEAAADGHGGKLQEGPPGAVILQYRFVKGEHGDAQLVILALLREPVDKFRCL